MTSKPLDNLVRIGSLKKEAVTQQEVDGLVQSGRNRLRDAQIKGLSFDSRFDLTYNASHALALAALRWHGYRSENRYLMFQCLEHTLRMEAREWKVLAKCHQRRNAAEYEGYLEADEQLVIDLTRITHTLLEKVSAMGPVP
jgi:hypothetical protein